MNISAVRHHKAGDGMKESLIFYCFVFNILPACDSIWALDYSDVYNQIHITETTVKMSCKHQYKALTELTFVHFNYFSEAG